MRLGRFQLRGPQGPVDICSSNAQKHALSPLPASAGEHFSGDHGEKVTPVPIPNTAVKGLIGEGTAGVARGRVARCRDLFQGAAGRMTCGPLFRLTVEPLNRLTAEPFDCGPRIGCGHEMRNVR